MRTARLAGLVLPGAILLTGCTATSGTPPGSCEAARGLAIDSINTFARRTGETAPELRAIDAIEETLVETGGGRYPLKRHCRGTGRLADGSQVRVLWVIMERQAGWLAGFGFAACVVGRTAHCVEGEP